MAVPPLSAATHRCLGEPLSPQLANAPQARPIAVPFSTFKRIHFCGRVLSSFSGRFQPLSSSLGSVTYVLLTRSPLTIAGAFDLHVLGMPPAFILSQDQTLHLLYELFFSSSFLAF